MLQQLVPEITDGIASALESVGQNPLSVPWVAYVGHSGVRTSLVARAQQNGVDVLLLASVAPARRRNRRDLVLQLELIEPASGQSVWKSKPISSASYRQLRARGRDLLDELIQELRRQVQRRYQLSRTPWFESGSAQSFAQQFVNSSAPPVEKLAVLKFLIKARSLSTDAARPLVEQVAGQALNLDKPSEALSQWLQRRLPPVR